MARSECHHCRRPTARCVCHAIRRLDNRVGVTIVQHPGERRHAFNTARLVRLGLAKLSLKVAWGGRLERPALPSGAALLYPGPGARELGELGAAERPSHLVVLDGTWPQARVLYRENAWLRALPHVALSPAAPSRYQIRAEPAPHCLSTIESVAAALALCEPELEGLEGLLDGFLAMVEGQLGRGPSRPASPRQSRRQRPSLLELLWQRRQDLVVLYVETTPPRGSATEGSLELVQLSAHRLSAGTSFDGLVAPRALPNPCELAQMGLSAELLSGAPALSQLAAQWRGFQRPDDLYLAWSRSGARLALELLGVPAQVLSLKSIYGNLGQRQTGRLDQVLRREGLAPLTLRARGRAGVRLGNAAALARWLGQRRAG